MTPMQNALGDAYSGLTLTPLEHRTSGDIAIRTFTAPEGGDPTACDPMVAECVPPWCAPQSLLVAELSNPAMVATRGAAVIGLASGSRMSLLDTVTAGDSEGSPVKVALVRVSADVARVRLSAPGVEDNAEPTKGLAVLAVPGSVTGAIVQALDKEGQPLQTLQLSDGPAISSAACRPLPIQPPKAGTPPADPKTAEAAIRAAYETAYTSVPGADPYAGLARVEGGAGLHATLDAATKNFTQAANTMTVTTGNLVFTSPTTAAIQYTLSYTGGAPWGTKYGRAVLVDGTWMVGRETFCGLLSFGGATCPKA